MSEYVCCRSAFIEADLSGPRLQCACAAAFCACFCSAALADGSDRGSLERP
jgi:hypothetical protein